MWEVDGLEGIPLRQGQVKTSGYVGAQRWVVGAVQTHRSALEGSTLEMLAKMFFLQKHSWGTNEAEGMRWSRNDSERR